ncbi:MAG: hypothetical protein ACM3H9_07275 [Rhodospirillaceae bacterium]
MRRVIPTLTLLSVLALVPMAAQQAPTKPAAQPAPAAAPAPTWITDGVPRLEMADHLKERANLKKSAAEREKEAAARK